MRFVSHTWNGFEIFFHCENHYLIQNLDPLSKILMWFHQYSWESIVLDLVKLTVWLRKLLDNGVDEDLIESKTKSMIWSSTNTDKTSISYVESYWNSAKPIIYLKICNVLWELSLFKSDAELQRLLTKMAVIYFWTCKL